MRFNMKFRTKGYVYISNEKFPFIILHNTNIINCSSEF